MPGQQQSKIRYKGVLATPIKDPPVPSFNAFSEETPEKWARDSTLKIVTELLEKIPALLAHYNLSPDNSERWFLLAMALARDHVPGFQVRKPRGRPKTKPRQQHPYWEIERLRLKGHSVSTAARIAVRKNGPLAGMNASTARRQYNKSNHVMRKVAKTVDENIGVGGFERALRETLLGEK